MGTITVGRENSTPVRVYYEDHGVGPCVVLIHGFPLDCRAWEKQITALLDAGHRVIAYDRRGFGSSSRPTTGYDYDTLASDLNTIIATLDLHEVVLAGEDMGTGEIIRYLSTYGSRRINRAILISPLAPGLLQGTDNPHGLDGTAYSLAAEALSSDRGTYLSDFLATAFNIDVELGKRISEEMLRYYWSAAMGASARGTAECLLARLAEFRSDLHSVDLPVLLIAGGRDRMVPFLATTARLEIALARSKLAFIEDASHGLLWTHADDVNRAIINFIDT